MIEITTTLVSRKDGSIREVVSRETATMPEPPTVEDYRRAVVAHLDATAQARLYDNGHALATYATSTNPAWAAEAAAFVAWRDAVWAQVYALWADPPDPAPSIADLIAGLPEITWP